jgi:N-acetylneuraminic acid mutarotase
MIAFGGNYLSSVEIFSSVTQTWTDLPPMMTERGVYPAACAVNKTRLIVCGGSNSAAGSQLSSCEMLDLTSQGLFVGWRWVPGMSTARTWTSGVLLPDNKTLLVTGGANSSTHVLSSCEKLDIAANTWSSVGNFFLGGPRHAHTSVLFNNSIVVLGGSNAADYLKTCERYDHVTNTWSVFPSFSAARHSFGAAVVLDKIYIAGGYNGTALSSVEVFNGASWSPLSPSLAQTRQLCAAVLFQNKVVVLGGSQSTIEVFDPITSTWNATFPPMRISPSRPYLAAVSQ